MYTSTKARAKAAQIIAAKHYEGEYKQRAAKPFGGVISSQLWAFVTPHFWHT